MNLKVEDVIKVHDIVIKETKGLPGIKSPNILESCVDGIYTTIGGEEAYPTHIDKAAKLIYNIVMMHPFADGNKRTAFISALYYLKLNGYVLRNYPEADTDSQLVILAVIKRRKDLSDIKKFLRKVMRSKYEKDN